MQVGLLSSKDSLNIISKELAALSYYLDDAPPDTTMFDRSWRLRMMDHLSNPPPQPSPDGTYLSWATQRLSDLKGVESGRFSIDKYPTIIFPHTQSKDKNLDKAGLPRENPSGLYASKCPVQRQPIPYHINPENNEDLKRVFGKDVGIKPEQLKKMAKKGKSEENPYIMKYRNVYYTCPEFFCKRCEKSFLADDLLAAQGDTQYIENKYFKIYQPFLEKIRDIYPKLSDSKKDHLGRKKIIGAYCPYCIQSKTEKKSISNISLKKNSFLQPLEILGGLPYNEQTLENGYNLISVVWKPMGSTDAIHGGQKKDSIPKMYPGVQSKAVLNPSYLDDDTSEEKRHWLNNEENKYTQTKIANDKNQKICRPCCFINPTQGWNACKINVSEESLLEKSVPSVKEKDDVKSEKYIMTNDSRTYPTPVGRYSMLPSDLHKMLNKNKNVHSRVLKDRESGFVRMGIQNNNFINAFFEIIKYPKTCDNESFKSGLCKFGENPQDESADMINTVDKLRIYLADKVSQNLQPIDNIFLRSLKNGDIYNMFSDFSAFLKNGSINPNILNDNLLLDLLSRPGIIHPFGLNIFIFEVDRENDKSWIKCPIGENFETLYSRKRKTIALIKYDEDKYEPIVHVEVSGSRFNVFSLISLENQPNYETLSNSLINHVIKSCSQLHESTNIQMLNGPTLQQFYNKTKKYLDDDFSFLKGFVVDNYNKLIGFLLELTSAWVMQFGGVKNNLVIFPIRRQGLPSPSYNYTKTHKFGDLQIYAMNSAIKYYISYENQVNFLKVISDLPGIQPIRKIIDDDNSTITAIITGANEIIPVKNDINKEHIKNIDGSIIPIDREFKYYQNINQSLLHKTIRDNPYLIQIKQELYKKEAYQRIRYELAHTLSERTDYLNEIKELIPYAEMNNKDAIKKLFAIIEKIINEITTVGVQLSIYHKKFTQPNIRTRCITKTIENCEEDLYCSYKNGKCSIKISSETLLQKFIQIIINEIIFNRIRRTEILNNQVDYIINSGQYLTTRPNTELIEKVDIVNVILTMFRTDLYRINIYNMKEKSRELRKDGINRDARIEIFNPDVLGKDTTLFPTSERAELSKEISKQPRLDEISTSVKTLDTEDLFEQELEELGIVEPKIKIIKRRPSTSGQLPIHKKIITLKGTKSVIKSGYKINLQIYYPNPEALSIFLHFINNKAGYEQPLTQVRVKEIRKKVGEGIGSKAIIPGPWEKFYIKKISDSDDLVINSGDKVKLIIDLDTNNYLCMSTENNKLVAKSSGLCKSDENGIFTIIGEKDAQPIKDTEIIELVHSNGTLIFSNMDVPKSTEAENYPSIQAFKIGYSKARILLWSEEAWNKQKIDRQEQPVVRRVIKTIKPKSEVSVSAPVPTSVAMRTPIPASVAMRTPIPASVAMRTTTIQEQPVSAAPSIRKVVRVVKPSEIKKPDVKKFTGLRLQTDKSTEMRTSVPIAIPASVAMRTTTTQEQPVSAAPSTSKVVRVVKPSETKNK
jgi:hypothetical protein